MAQLGEMVNSMTHQWKQPLNIISIVADELSDAASDQEIDREKKVAENAKIIIDQVAFMSRTMDDFSGFTSPKDRIKEFYICEACSDALRLVEHTINYNHVNVHVSCGERIPVTGSKNDLIHVLINLITNSIDAFSSRKIENPEIRICAEKCNDKKNVRSYIETMQGGVERDHGRGDI